MSLIPTVTPPPPASRLDDGAPLPAYGWRDHAGAAFAPVAGGPLVLVAAARADAPEAARAIAALAAVADRLESAGAAVAIITAQPVADNARVRAAQAIPFALLSDPMFAFGRALGLDPAMGRFAGLAAVVVDGAGRIAGRHAGTDAGRLAEAVLARLDAMPRAAATAAIVRHQAPVLTVPGLLAPEHCARLIALWEGGDRVEGRVDGDRGGRRLLKADVKVRDDVFLPDLEPPTQEIFAIFRARLLPEIEKAFHFAVTRVETLRIGCYDGARRGYFAAHRDNTVPSTLHRRFAMSLNLNADYDGGALRFPEYGGPPYKPDTGGAVIFSCALLHEAMPVTRGRRFGIFGFFFGEAEEAARYARNPSFSTTRIDRPVTAASSPP